MSCSPREGEQGGQRRNFLHVLAADYRQHQQDKADQRHFADGAGSDVTRIYAHEAAAIGNGGGNGKGAPGRFGQGLDHNQRQHCQQDEHDEEGAEQGDHAGYLPQLGFDQIAQRTAVAPRGNEQHGEILHRAGKHDASQQPQHAGHIAHLRGQYRADQRTGSGNRGKVMTEQYVFVGWHIVQPVVELVGRRHAGRVQPQYPAGNELAVKAVGDGVDADRGDHDPDGADRFAAMQAR